MDFYSNTTRVGHLFLTLCVVSSEWRVLNECSVKPQYIPDADDSLKDAVRRMPNGRYYVLAIRPHTAEISVAYATLTLRVSLFHILLL